MKKLIPFDLEKAKNGARVVTRCGYPVRMSDFNVKDQYGYTLIGIIDIKGNEAGYGFMETGRRSETEESDYDLFIEEEIEETRRENIVEQIVFLYQKILKVLGKNS